METQKKWAWHLRSAVHNVLQMCIACQEYPQLGHSVPFVQGTSNFMLCSFKYHQRSGTHSVSLALWQAGGGVMFCIVPCVGLQGGM